jgi:hypothetical protein
MANKEPEVSDQVYDYKRKQVQMIITQLDVIQKNIDAAVYQSENLEKANN